MGAAQDLQLEELKFLDEIVVKGDTWATFMAFTDAWKKLDYRDQNKFKQYLPRVLDEENEIHDEDEIEENYEEICTTQRQNIIDLLKTQQHLITYSVLITIALIYMIFSKF